MEKVNTRDKMPGRETLSMKSENRDAYGGNSKPRGKQWLFGIGISKYVELPNLTNAVKDVKDVINVLTEDYGVSRLNTVTLFDENANRENLIHQLDQLAEKVGSDDSLLIYFAGHGYLNTTTDMGYWIPYDAKKGRTSLYIGNSTIRDHLKAIKSKHTLLIADSCFSGSFFVRGASRSSVALQELESIPSRWAICSGRHDEEVSDGVPGGNSPFAQSILDALGGNTNQLLNVAKLADRVVEQTRSNYEQLPEGNPIQGVGHKGGQYIFHRKANEGKFWENCQSKNTIRDYGQYLSQFPDGKHTTVALARIKKLEDEDEEVWKMAETSGTLAALHEYIRRDSAGKHIDEAREKILAMGKKNKVPAFLFLSRRRFVIGVVTLLVITLLPWGKFFEYLSLPKLAQVPVALLLPELDGPVGENAARQWEGFRLAFDNHDIEDADRHFYHFNYPLRDDGVAAMSKQLEDWYEKGVRTFIITMSGAAQIIKPLFIEWTDKLPSNDRPVLVVTVAGAEGIPDLEKGVIRNYISMENEADLVSTYIKAVGPSRIGIFRVDDSKGRATTERIMKHGNLALSSEYVDILPIKLTDGQEEIERLVEDFVRKEYNDEKTVAVIIGYGESTKLTLESLRKAPTFDGEILVLPTFREEVWRTSFGLEDKEFVKRIHVIGPRPLASHKDNPGVAFQFSFLTLDRALGCKMKRGIEEFWYCFKNIRSDTKVFFDELGDAYVPLELLNYEEL